uniref:Uncharacterized protein n=1 Tax=Arcella intermedia TaxID=1963864 RepID=A0A6B2LM13_9EUKA
MTMIGECGVGKSSLLRRYTQSKFVEDYEKTVGVEFGSKIIVVGDNKVKLQLWDISGDPTFDELSKSYYRGCRGVLILYDITDVQSFATVPKWIDRVHQNSCKSPIMLVGTKADQEHNRQVSTQEGQGLADLHNLYFMEVSSKSTLNVEEDLVF